MAAALHYTLLVYHWAFSRDDSDVNKDNFPRIRRGLVMEAIGRDRSAWFNVI